MKAMTVLFVMQSANTNTYRCSRNTTQQGHSHTCFI